jgi:hypothetical protein
MEKTKKITVGIFATLMLVAGFFTGFYVNQAIRPQMNQTYVNIGGLALGVGKIQCYYYLNGVFMGHNDANITNQGKDQLRNKTIPGTMNYEYNWTVVGLSNSTLNYGATTTHVCWIFNDTAGQGNGLGRKTLTIDNVTLGTTGKWNLTAKYYPQESINNVCKVFLAWRSDTTYNCYIAIDNLTPIRDVVVGDTLTLIFVNTLA